MTTNTAAAATSGTVMITVRRANTVEEITAQQVVDIVASYLDSHATMPGGHTAPGDDPTLALHVLYEEHSWGNVAGFVVATAPERLHTLRCRAQEWARDYFGPDFPRVVAA